jgi:hypothetical protein
MIKMQFDLIGERASKTGLNHPATGHRRQVPNIAGAIQSVTSVFQKHIFRRNLRELLNLFPIASWNEDYNQPSDFCSWDFMQQVKSVSGLAGTRFGGRYCRQERVEALKRLAPMTAVFTQIPSESSKKEPGMEWLNGAQRLQAGPGPRTRLNKAFFLES